MTGPLCGATVTILLGACGETSQHPGDGSLDKAGKGAGGTVATASGSGASGANVGGSGGGAKQGQGDPTCPTSQPAFGSACKEGQSCFYRGSTNPCAPPDVTYTCHAGNWDRKSAAQVGVCVAEGCPNGTASYCPPDLPPQGAVCGFCSVQASCQYGMVGAQCALGLWQVDRAGGGGAGGAGGEAGGEP